MKKRTYRMEQKLKKMRKKYFGDIASEEYIRTGKPRIIREKEDAADDRIAKMITEADKDMKKKLRKYKKEHKKKTGEELDESQVIFV